MNFKLSDEQLALREAASVFALKEMWPYASTWDEEAYFPVDVIKKAGDLGFLSLYIPEEFGGLGLPRLEASLIFEALAMGCTSTTAYMTIHNMATWMLASFGSSLVREVFLPKLISGEYLASYCLTEPNAGSDAAALITKAVCKGDTYQLTGTKSFISGAGSTQILIVMARTGNVGSKGISAFVVPAESTGITYGRLEKKMGWNSQPTRTITFDHVSIPKKYRLGEEGEGFKFAMMGLDGGRINIASCSVGTAQQAFNQTQQYIAERHQFGKPLSAQQALQFRIADMATELVAARQLVRLAAFHLDQRASEATMYCAMAKRFASDIGFKICNEALQLHGGYGYIKEYPLERHVRDTRVHCILEGSNEIMRLIISRKILENHALLD
ncbi:MAG: acyl-CoA dehydrogenase [Endozoicomonadaceae bacterium]|nr:acyl-CoA dehydrogenase [Endozoicomonadaceae bacterium]